MFLGPGPIQTPQFSSISCVQLFSPYNSNHSKHFTRWGAPTNVNRFWGQGPYKPYSSVSCSDPTLQTTANIPHGGATPKKMLQLTLRDLISSVSGAGPIQTLQSVVQTLQFKPQQTCHTVGPRYKKCFKSPYGTLFQVFLGQAPYKPYSQLFKPYNSNFSNSQDTPTQMLEFSLRNRISRVSGAGPIQTPKSSSCSNPKIPTTAKILGVVQKARSNVCFIMREPL